MVRDEKSCSGKPALLAALLVLFFAPRIQAGSGPRRLDLALNDRSSAVERAVSDAVRQAASKLADPVCREVFSDFRDAAGQTIQQNLDSLGQSASNYLGWVLFYDGHGYSRCDARGIFASTSPGSRIVYICAPQFLEKQHRDPGQASALIIHEQLHSLGLGENPPDSKEITARMIARCGR